MARPASAAAPAARRRGRALAGALLAFSGVSALLHASRAAFALPAASRRGASAAAAAALLGQAGVLPAVAEDKKTLGFVPAEYVAKKVGEKVTTPNGLIYEPLELGTDKSGPRDGPPRSGSNVVIRFTGHIDSFDGPIFDSTKYRGSRKPGKPDVVEVRLNLDPTVSNGMFEALKLMKVGAKGRFIQPPILSYNEGKTGFEGDEMGEAKGKIPGDTTLYYEVELVDIVKP